MATVVAAPSLIGIEALGRVLVAGVLIQYLLVAVGSGTAPIRYFGLQEFEPARMPK